MSGESVSLNIDQKIVEEIVTKKIGAEIAMSMGNVKDELIQRLVDLVLRQAVDDQGKPTDREYYKKGTMIEHLIKDQIRDIASETLKTVVSESRPMLEKKIRDAMKKSHSKLVQVFMDSLERQLSSKWAVNLNVTLSEDR